MEITDLLKRCGRRKRRKRLGRGTGSGRGKTSTRGHKGCGARAGGGPNMLREGGQMVLFRRLPKRGFNNVNFRRAFALVNLRDLEDKFDAGAHVTGQALVEAGLVRSLELPVKVLGSGTLTKKLTVEAGKFSKQAEEKIKAAGGDAMVVEVGGGRQMRSK